MNKILPALIVVVLLVVGGLWFARPAVSNSTSTAQAQAESGSTESASETTETTSEETTSETETTESSKSEATETESAETEPSSEDGTTEESTTSGESTPTEETTSETTESTESAEATETTESIEATEGTESATPATETESTGETSTETTDAASENPTSEDATATAPAEPPALPEGFALTPFLNEEQQREFGEAEQVLEEGKDYQAIIVTNKGNIVIDLFEDQAPQTVNNFVFLARNKFYDGIVFHRVLTDFMAQTGDPTGTGSGGPGYQFEDEFVEELKFDKRGVLAMANSGPNTNGSQFFITFAPTEWLNGLHSIFGQMIEGDEVLSNIKIIDPSQDANSPSVIAMMTDTLESLQSKGIALAGDATLTLEAYLTEKLGEIPEVGAEFEIDGVRAQSGRMGEAPAVGFFTTEAGETPEPDVMQAVYIIEKAK
ncbi:MAG: peptidylprolyl isomerase [Trueperaceae bacterium]